MCCYLFIIIYNYTVVLGAVSTGNLFDFGFEAGDSRLPNGDDTFINVTLTPTQGFRYFNSSYKSLFVNVNGAISFVQGVQQYTPDCGSLSMPMIIPFWSDVDTRSNGSVYYRESSNRDSLRQASQDVVKAFPQFGSISLGWMFITTWDEVPFFGASAVCNGISLRNTFQSILTTDGTHSFVILYYNNITWTTGTSSGGNCTGQGGLPAKAGFDVGDNLTFYTIPGTCTPEIINVAETSNINEPGKWVFRIDEEFESVSCENYDHNQKLYITPSFVSLLGHMPITLKGPCLENVLNVTCHFFDVIQGVQPIVVVGTVSADLQSVVCQVPYLYSYERLKVDLNVLLVNSTTNTYSGYVYTSIPENDELIFEISDDRSTFTISWDPTAINADNSSTNFHLELSLTEMNGHLWTERGVIAQGIQNTGSYNGTISPAGQAILSNLSSHFVVKVSPLNNATTTLTTSLFSVPKFLKHNESNDFFVELCNSWYESDNGPPQDVLTCPPLLEQALVDQRFEQDKSVALDYFHPGADYSFRQRVASLSGAGQQCVYKNGMLLLGPPGGGTADLFSPTSISGFISHLQYDVYPWLICCKFSNDDESCRKYYEKRPSDGGNGYIPPNPGNGNGDPHLTTFDGLSYMFNGVGEFWMVQTIGNGSNTGGSFEMQARMEQFLTVDGSPTNASIFTAFVIKETRTAPANFTSDTVIVQVSAGTLGIQVTLDNEQLDFDVQEEGATSRSLSYNGVAISVHSVSKISLSFQSGFSFDFIMSDGAALNIMGSASSKFANSINGLLGQFDGNPDNDFETPSGTVVSKDASLETIHNDFGLKWIITEAESLFTYPPGTGYASFYNPFFVPTFVLPDISTVPDEIKDLCQGALDCIFDFVTTGSKSLANSSREISLAINQTMEAISIPVEMCELPIDIVNGYVEVSNLFLGSNVTYKCNNDYQLSGNSIRSCQKISDEKFSWSGNEPVCLQQATSPPTSPATSPSTEPSLATSPSTETNKNKANNLFNNMSYIRLSMYSFVVLQIYSFLITHSN